jgi:hypothetical protein
MPVKNIRVTMISIRKQVTDTINTGIFASVTRLKNELMLATPVDTGEARDSWKINKVKVNENEQVYEITNDVPYIGALNEGHSDQAPAHFIETIALRYGRAKGQIVTYKDE